MTARFWLLAFFAFGIFSGVRSTVERKGPPRPAHKADCTVEIFDSKGTDRPHDIVGTIQVYVRRNKITMGREATYEEAVPEFRKQACKLGADAIIVVQQTVSHSGEFKLLYVKGDAIGFTTKSPE
jgi:uncharacterized protein YbjQ (UPF0145 family)